MAFAKTFVGLACVALVASVTTGKAAATPTAADPAPTVASVTAQLDTLGRQSEQLAERFNAATINLAKVRSELVSAQHKVLAATARRDRAQVEFVQLVQAQYEDGPANAFGSMMTSGSRQTYLDQQNYSDLAAAHSADIVTELRTATKLAADAKTAQAKLVKQARAQVKELAADRAQVQARTTQLTTLLATLTAAQRRAYEARDAANRAQLAAITAKNTTKRKTDHSPAASNGKSSSKHSKSHNGGGTHYNVHATTAAAQRAVDFALDQVGKPYSYASAGPGSYDCSGLTMASWRRGGVSLPHQASAQYSYGHHVSIDNLQPGDLIFLYWPIGHVEIYIGHGLAVSAPQTGENVKIISISRDRSEIHGATRLT